MNRLQYFFKSLIFTPVYDTADILIAYASQTGTGARLAKQSASLLREQGQTATAQSMSELRPAELAGYKQVLMIVSTCGEGAIPDDGIEFYEQLRDYPSLNTPVSLLALGDRAYENFCTAGIAFHEQLLRLGATSDREPVKVSGNPVEAWQQWLTEQTKLSAEALSGTDATELAGERPLTLELVENTPLHQQAEEGNQAYRLSFQIHSDQPDSEPVSYKPGDLLAITPPGDNRERLYSIASAPSAKANHVELCVGLLSYQNEGETVFGQCSHYLTHELKPGDKFAASWKASGGLPLPEAEQPLIMIATGAGIAPMNCLLQERLLQQHDGDNWLIFGNRKASADYYYREEFEGMNKSGHLNHLETAFSRDGDKKVYVQDVLGQSLDRLLDWLVNQNGRLYVCGRTDLREGVLACVTEALSAIYDKDQADSQLKQMMAEQRICFELF